MPQQLSRFPAGLLDLVGSQNFGENPRQMADVVAPVLDIGQQYLVTLQQAAFGTNAAAAAGFNAMTNVPLIVPSGELWKVVALNTTVVSAAGQTGKFSPGVRIGGTAGPSFPLGDPVNYVASENNWTFWDMTEFWAPAGYEFGALLQQVVGGAPTLVQVAMIYSRLRA
jgi:hypothetical protein